MESLGESLKLKTEQLKGSIKLKASTKKKDVNWVRNKASYLASALRSPEYLPFFQKVAWRLPEPQIDDILDRARHQPGITSPLYYFIGCCKSEMGI